MCLIYDMIYVSIKINDNILNGYTYLLKYAPIFTFTYQINHILCNGSKFGVYILSDGFVFYFYK